MAEPITRSSKGAGIIRPPEATRAWPACAQIPRGFLGVKTSGDKPIVLIQVDSPDGGRLTAHPRREIPLWKI